MRVSSFLNTGYKVFFFICRNEEFRKKASISFGIQFDNDKYELLQTYLGEIFKHKDRVSIYFELKNQKKRIIYFHIL